MAGAGSRFEEAGYTFPKPLIDVNGNLDVSGTLTQAGVATFSVAANVAQVALTSSSNAVAWDASAKPNAFHVTTENTTFSAPSNNVEGAFICSFASNTVHAAPSVN